MAIDEQRRALRAAIIHQHLTSENAQDFDATIATFTHPRYEIIPTGQVYDGEKAVRGYYAATRAAFPDQRNEVHHIHHAEDSVIVEFDLLGTHRGPFAGFAPTGRSFRVRMVAIFEFTAERITCERVYFDLMAMLSQLGLLGAPTGSSSAL